ncbi:hypothetical protein GCM10027403_17620 [Arthrobacter tecti]
MPSTSPTDPTSPAFGVASTFLMGALPLLDTSKLEGNRRRAAHVATAVVTGLYVAFTVDRKSTTLVPLKPVAGFAAAALTLGFADAGEAVDSRISRKLRSAGIRQPRAWMAAGAAALTFVTFLADRAAARKEELEEISVDEPDQLRPLDPAVRQLLDGMLHAAAVVGARELITQLDAVREVYWDDEFCPTVQFRVPDELPRAIPHNQTYPVRALFQAEDGTALQILLQVFEGKLDHLSVETLQSGFPDDLVDGWPDSSEVTYVLDGADGSAVPVDSQTR